MIILAQDRKDNLHLVDYTHNGKKWALCGVIYFKKDIINTLALDNIVHNVCKKCLEAHYNIYGKSIDPRAFKTSSQNNLVSNATSYVKGHRHLEHKYWYLEQRYSESLNRCKRKLARL